MSSTTTATAPAEKQTFSEGNAAQDSPILISTTSFYEKIWDDSGSKAKTGVTIFRPTPSNGFFTIGDYAVRGQVKVATSPAITVQIGPGQSGELPALAEPADWNLVWQAEWMQGQTKIKGAIWAAVPPDGYVGLGHVATNGLNKPAIANFRCVRYDLVEITKPGELIWSDAGVIDGTQDVSLYDIVGVENAFFSQANFLKPQFIPYKLKSS